MIQCINNSVRTARKIHRCDFCGGDINIGEKYIYQFNKDDYAYEWKAHASCQFLSNELYDFINPWEGMTQDEFTVGTTRACHWFVCPRCEYLDEYDDCVEGASSCINKLLFVLKNNELTHDKLNWHLVPRKERITEYRGIKI